MLKQRIKFTDFLGNEREEEFYFNLGEAETAKLELGEKGGLTTRINKIIESQDIPEITKLFDYFIRISIGYISPDGREFVKSKEFTDSFFQSNAYNKFYMDLLTKPGMAAKFVNEVIPDLSWIGQENKSSSNVVEIDSNK